MECAEENKTGQFTENVDEGRPWPQPLPMRSAGCPLHRPAEGSASTAYWR